MLRRGTNRGGAFVRQEAANRPKIVQNPAALLHMPVQKFELVERQTEGLDTAFFFVVERRLLVPLHFPDRFVDAGP